jgi:hypothetical protein
MNTPSPDNVTEAYRLSKFLRPNFERMPSELKQLKNWVLWRYLPPKPGGGKWRKVPFQPNGSPADSTDPLTWSRFEDCCAAYNSGGFSGIGFCFDGVADENGLVYAGVDFDSGAFVGEGSSRIREWIDRFGSYVEASVSGKGVHVITKANPLATGVSHGGIELYTSKRYFAMTGCTQGEARPIVSAPVTFAALIQDVMKSSGKQINHQNVPVHNVVPFKMPERALTARPAAVFDDDNEPDNLAAGLEPNIEEIRCVVEAIPSSALAGEPDWVRIARALAHTAAEFPDLKEPLWEILDTASRRAPGYNEQDNRSRYDRYIREALTCGNPITLGTVYHLAAAHGRQGSPGGNGSSGHSGAAPGGPAGATTAATFTGASGFTGPTSGSNPIRAVHVSSLPLIPPKRQWLHGTDLIRGAVTVLVAPGGRAKSTWLLTCALACASGRPLLGPYVFGGPLRVLCLSTEDGTPEMALRLRAAMAHHQLTDADLPGLHVIGADRWGLSLLRADRNQAILDSGGITALTTELDYAKPDVLIIDPLINLMGGVSANDNAAAALLMRQLVGLATERRVAIALAHHTAKGRDPASPESALGAASFINLARIALSIEPLDEKDAGKIGLPPWEAWSVFRVLGTKQNFSRPNSEDRWFRLVTINMPNADPPIYMNGDDVAVVEQFKPGSSGPAFPPELIRDALAAVDSADPPLSPSPQSRTRYAAPIMAGMVARHRGRLALDAEGKALLDHLLASDLVGVKETKLARPGSRSDKRKSLVLTAAGRVVLQQSNPFAPDTPPQSPRSPAIASQETAGGDPLGSPAPQGGCGGNAGGQNHGADVPPKVDREPPSP